MPYCGHARSGSRRRFAVGYPSVPPRWSPLTTTPSSSNGRPSFAAEPLEQCEISRAPHAEAEIRAGDDDLHPCRAQEPLGELLGRELLELGREGGDEDVCDTGVLEQLEPAIQRGEELDPVSEGNPRVWIERD